MVHRFELRAQKPDSALPCYCVVLPRPQTSRVAEMAEKASYPRSISFALGRQMLLRYTTSPPGTQAGAPKVHPRRPPTDRFMTSLPGTRGALPLSPHSCLTVKTQQGERISTESTAPNARRVGARPNTPGPGRQKEYSQVSFASTFHLHALPMSTDQRVGATQRRP